MALQVFSPIVVIVTVYKSIQKFNKWFLYIKILRKNFINSSKCKESSCCSICCCLCCCHCCQCCCLPFKMIRIFCKIFCGYFLCQSCRVDRPEDDKKVDIKGWKKFSEILYTIKEEDLRYMKEKYVHYEYSHKHYCLPKGKKSAFIMKITNGKTCWWDRFFTFWYLILTFHKHLI